MKIKAWIIKHLGGYTKEEYDKVNQVAQMPVPVYKRYDVPIRIFKACYKYDEQHRELAEEAEYVFRHLVNQLSESLLDEGMIRFLQDDNRRCYR